MKITHVAEIRFSDLDETATQKVESALREAVQNMGILPEQVEIHVHDANVKFQWKVPALGSDAPSQAQLGYAKKLFAELKSKAGVNELALRFITEIENEMKSGTITKQSMSPLIDAMKEAIADLNFQRVGVRALED